MTLPTLGGSGQGRAIGCDYRKDRRELYFVEPEGRVSRIALATHQYRVLGTGYEDPLDILLGEDGVHAFVTERAGALLRIELGKADRRHAAFIRTGLSHPHLLGLLERTWQALVVESGAHGRLLAVDLRTGHLSVIAEDLSWPTGLMLSADGQVGMVQERPPGGEGYCLRIDLRTGERQTMVTDIRSPFYQSWVPVAARQAPSSEPADGMPVAAGLEAERRRVAARNLPRLIEDPSEVEGQSE